MIRTFSAADSQAIASTVNTLLSTIQTESQQITDNFISESAQAQATINNAISSIANAVEIKGTLGFTIPAEHYTDLVFTTPDFFYEIADLDGENPPLTLIRGETYTFNFEGVSETHPIALRLSADDQTEVPGATGNDSINGVQGTGAIVTYIVPLDAPNSIVYQCAVHQTMIGLITIVDEIIYPTIHTLPTTYGVG